MTDGIPTVAELMDSLLAGSITLAVNDCRYSGTAEELITSYVHPLFLKTHSATSMGSLPMSIGKPWKFKLLHWKLLVHGMCWSMTLRLCQTLFVEHGHLNERDFLMA